MIGRKIKLAAMAAIGLTLSGCTTFGDGYHDDYGYGGGYASGGYSDYGCDPWDAFDSYYGCDSRYGYGNIGFGGGWWNNFYYPGSGLYIFDRGGRRYQMRDDYRRYWGQQRWQWYRERRGRGDGDWRGRDRDRPGYGQPGRPDGDRPGTRPGRPGGWDRDRDGRPDGVGRPDRDGRPDRWQGRPRTQDGTVDRPRPGTEGTPGRGWQRREGRSDGARGGWRGRQGGESGAVLTRPQGERGFGGNRPSRGWSPPPSRPQAAPPAARPQSAPRAAPAPRGDGPRGGSRGSRGTEREN